MSNDEVHSDLVSLVKTVIFEVLESAPEDLVGLALCTDDELTTLYATWLTSSELDLAQEPDELLFSPTDWAASFDGGKIEEAARELRTLASDPRHVERSFASLVSALEEMRKERALPDSLFLSVLSTDPSEYLEDLEAESVRTLNSSDVIDRRNAFLARWQ